MGEKKKSSNSYGNYQLMLMATDGQGGTQFYLLFKKIK